MCMHDMRKGTLLVAVRELYEGTSSIYIYVGSQVKFRLTGFCVSFRQRKIS